MMERAETVTLSEILAAREARVQRQRELLARFRKPLVCFTMNIAGPVKTSPLIERGFRLGCIELDRQLMRVQAPVLYREKTVQASGCEAFYVVDLQPEALKRLALELEEGSALGRLFDMDVLTADGIKLEREEERGCLICGKPGRDCVRSRAHPVEALQARTDALLQTALLRADRERIAELAQRALLYEVCVTPKPGLVDRNNSGSHRDMDIYTFLNSTAALGPYFLACAQIGQETAQTAAETSLAALRLPGKQAERAMLAATGGVNTHKGAIFSMGILCAALGRLDPAEWGEPAQVLQECAAMTKGLTARELTGLTEETAVTAGERLYLRYGVTGIRGQLEAGLPTVLSHGLPVLEQNLAQGRSPDEAGCAALLALIASTEDTNLMARGGPEGQRWAAEAAGKCADPAALDRACMERNLSPGGCADLLAICWMLHFLKEDAKNAHG